MGMTMQPNISTEYLKEKETKYQEFRKTGIFERRCPICETEFTDIIAPTKRQRFIPKNGVVCPECRAFLVGVYDQVLQHDDTDRFLKWVKNHPIALEEIPQLGPRVGCPLCLSQGDYGMGFSAYKGLDMHLRHCRVFKWMDDELLERSLRREEQQIHKEEKHQTDDGYVYLIRESLGGYLKIGKSVRPKDRLRELSAAQAGELKLLGTIKTDRKGDLEKELHKEFSQFRRSGEWFENHSDILKRFNCL